MGYADLIAREINFLSVDKQVEVLDFIEFLKSKQRQEHGESTPRNPGEIAAFFRSFEVDVRGFKFDREEANAR